MALYIKANVRFGSNVFAMCIASQVVDGIFRSIERDCTITSANDSTHSATSLHSKDGAIDVRSKILTEAEKDWVLSEMKTRLNDGYDILLENRGKEQEHFHLEYDPLIKKST